MLVGCSLKLGSGRDRNAREIVQRADVRGDDACIAKFHLIERDGPVGMLEEGAQLLVLQAV